MELRPYQVEAVNAVKNSFLKGHHRVLMVLPTGCGKTVVFSEIARRTLEKGNRVLIIAHREELLDQARQKLWQVAGLRADIERANLHASAQSSVIVASVQTLCREVRLNEFAPDHFALIIIDEAHHALTPSYKKVIDYFEKSYVLGVTATPDRADKQKLSKVFEDLAYDYSIADAVNDGYLVRPVAQTVNLNIDLSKVRIKCGDYDVNSTAKALYKVLDEIADAIKDVCATRRKVVVFLPLVEISQNFAKCMQLRGIKAAEVNGESINRAEILADFAAEKYQVLCNSMLLTEGWDCPAVDCVVVLRPTKSRALYVQMIGRGMRLAPDKKDLLILDFMWLTGKHLLCHPSSLSAENEETTKETNKRLSSSKPVDVFEACEQVKKERDVKTERSKSIIENISQYINKGEKFDLLKVDQVIESLHLESYRPKYKSDEDPITPKQLETLNKLLRKAKFDLDANVIATKGLASAMIGSLSKRIHDLPPTEKQIKTLTTFGFKNVSKWFRKSATKLLAEIVPNGWHVPANIDPETYVPEEGLRIA